MIWHDWRPKMRFRAFFEIIYKFLVAQKWFPTPRKPLQQQISTSKNKEFLEFPTKTNKFAEELKATQALVRIQNTECKMLASYRTVIYGTLKWFKFEKLVFHDRIKFYLAKLKTFHKNKNKCQKTNVSQYSIPGAFLSRWIAGSPTKSTTLKM